MDRKQLYLALLGWTFCVSLASAQYTVVSAPFISISDSYYERIGVDFDFDFGRNSNFFFNRGAIGALPPFGGFDPNSQGTFGFRAGPFSANLFAAQGSGRTMTVVTPSVVVPNGGTGSVFSGTTRPFVTGVVPVVGARPTITSPLADRLKRLKHEQPDGIKPRKPKEAVVRPANRVLKPKDDAPLVIGKPQLPAQPVPNRRPAVAPPTSGQPAGTTNTPAKITPGKNRSASKDDLKSLVLTARALEKTKPGVARIYYRLAAAKASGTLKTQLLEKADRLKSGPLPRGPQ